MSDEFNPYKLGTGLRDDFDGTIREGLFSEGNILFVIETDEGDEVSQRYSIGTGWESYDAGSTVRHPSGPRTLFNESTAYGSFMQAAWESGADDAMMDMVRQGKGPTHSDNWNGMNFHWNILQVKTRRPKVDDNGEAVLDEQGKKIWQDVKIPRLLPTKFLGYTPGVSAGQGGAGAPAPSASTSDPLSVLDPVTAARVRQAGKESDSYQTFVTRMLDLTDKDDVPIMERLEIGMAVADESWYASLHNG